ncbi:WecB/TagA/CpsF family glycosyltransferase [Patescibacteria group bacterium]|jgi:N-acetylglucosaminyldiphosphoundecaprenol N-acetyl-beta-D-mannosaminyltransferase|nr:WecB/TagA/CpsF family glycosyltransferase [Patescibacteria group bacterium]
MASNRVLGVPIDGLGWGAIEGKLKAGEKLWMVTANPEILLRARKDKKYREVISSAELRLVDGFGLFLVSYVLRRKTVRLTGVELSEHLLQYAWKNHLRVGLLGGEFGEAGGAAEKILEAYPGLELLAEEGGGITESGSEDAKAEAARERLILFSPQILLVAFGAPRQELWIHEHRNEFADLRAVVGVGGTFNFWAGRIRRAPAWMRTVGLEWAWRLLQEPRRIGRIWRAVVIFPILALFDSFR